MASKQECKTLIQQACNVKKSSVNMLVETLQLHQRAKAFTGVLCYFSACRESGQDVSRIWIHKDIWISDLESSVFLYWKRERERVCRLHITDVFYYNKQQNNNSFLKNVFLKNVPNESLVGLCNHSMNSPLPFNLKLAHFSCTISIKDLALCILL